MIRLILRWIWTEQFDPGDEVGEEEEEEEGGIEGSRGEWNGSAMESAWTGGGGGAQWR